MPLIDLQTDLKSLRFGRDRFGNGSSNQPYIITPIPEAYNAAPESIGDYILRGGSLRLKTVLEGESRLLKFLSDTKNPNSFAFLAKQVALARLGTKTIGQPTRVYNPLNTALQVADPTGFLHISKDGYRPFLFTDKTITYEYQTATQNIQTPELNRLYTLTNNKINGNTNDTSIQYGVTRNPLHILRYGGGPGSEAGIGFTYIKRQVDTTFNNPTIDNLGTLNLTFTNKLLGELRLYQPGSTQVYGNSAVQSFYDFRQEVVEKSTDKQIKEKLLFTPYNNFNRTKTYQLPDSGLKSNIRKDQYQNSTTVDGKIVADPITLKPIYSDTQVDQELKDLDFIRFYLAVLDNDSTDGTKEFIHLRALLSSISDSFSAGFNDFTYVGRAETFKTYNSFSRSFNFSLKVAALSKDELNAISNKVNYIASLTAPDYSQGGFMRPNIVYLTLGNYLNDVPGYIESVSITVPDETTWEIARKVDEAGDVIRDTTTQQMPMYMELSISFFPIHSILPQKGARFLGTANTAVITTNNVMQNFNVEG